jgi:hypothetical protein
MHIEYEWPIFFLVDGFEALFDKGIREESEVAASGNGNVLTQNPYC